MKLIYLADVYHMERYNSRITDVPFIHWHYGPWAAEVESEMEYLCGEGILEQKTYLTRAGYKAEVPKPKVKKTTVELSDTAQEILDDVIEEWSAGTSDEIITYAKTSLPFVGTPFGEEIDFTRMDIAKEIAKEKNISIEDAATLIVENNKELMKSLDRAKEKAKSQSLP